VGFLIFLIVAYIIASSIDAFLTRRKLREMHLDLLVLRGELIESGLIDPPKPTKGKGSH
jgi:hypothetical protein